MMFLTGDVDLAGGQRVAKRARGGNRASTSAVAAVAAEQLDAGSTDGMLQNIINLN